MGSLDLGLHPIPQRRGSYAKSHIGVPPFQSEPYLLEADLVKALFDTPSAQAILSMPMPSRPSLNRLICVPDSKGCFLVKSAPHLPDSLLWNKLEQIVAVENSQKGQNFPVEIS